MKIKALIFVLFLFSSFTWADWVWTSETGWINTRYNPRGNAQSILESGQKQREQKRPRQAVDDFSLVFENYPNTPEAEKSLWLAAETEYESNRFYEAHLLYEKYLSRYPGTNKRPQVLERQYKIGSGLIRSEDNETQEAGVDILAKIIQASPYAVFSDDAVITIANYYFKKEMFLEAEESYTKLVKEYPKSEWHGFAQYQTAMCSLKRFRGLYYDPEPLRLAEEKLGKYFSDHKDGTQAESAIKKRGEVRGKLAEKEWQTALYYLNKDQVLSARIYLRHIVKKFPETQMARKAQLKLNILKSQGKIK